MSASLFGIWCYDAKDRAGDWLRESRENGEGLISFFSIRAAQRRAAFEYGFTTYTRAKRNGWCEVRPLTP